MADEDKQELKGDEAIIKEAKDRFDRCKRWESDFRKLFVEDLKFANADSDNGYQWPDDYRKQRNNDNRPCLTINKTKQHCFQIINDGRQHAQAIHIHPIDGGATVEAAKLLDGLVRHIEYQSNAQSAYNTGNEFAVFGGIGYWRVVTDYANDESFDQDIFIRRVKNPLSIHLDPDISELDGSDAGFGFVEDNRTKDTYAYKYGKKAAEEAQFTSEGGDDWLGKDHIKVVEYYRRVPHKEQIAAVDPELLATMPEELQATGGIIKRKDIDPELWKEVVKHESVRVRDVDSYKVEWFLIAGNKIVDRKDWLGKYIPIVRDVGEELIIDGMLERKGHVRSLKDPQRMYNYWTSSGTEQVALQGKTPYVASERAIAGYESYWKNANNENYTYLPYNDIDENGQPVERPQRQQPPVMAQAYLEGMKIAASEMMMVSGQYQAVMGQQSNETSGVAINARQRQGDNSTYHYIDHHSAAIRFTGMIVIDLIPKVFDTARVMRILGEDGVEDFVHIDPSAKEALQKRKDQMTQEVRQILNPSVGRYSVVVDTGPAYATRRQEAFAAMSQIMAKNGELMDKAGDLMFKAADFPMAQEIAERLNRAVPAALKEDGPPPELQQAQQQVQQLQQALQAMHAQMTAMKQGRDVERVRATADVYRAETDRAKAMHEIAADQTQSAHDFATTAVQMAQTEQQINAPPDQQQPTQPPSGGFFSPENRS